MKAPKPVSLIAGVIALLTLVSYAISYEQLYVVANHSGIWHPLTFGYGLLLEGFVSVATVTAFVCGFTGLAVYPWTVAWLAFCFSAWINYSAGAVPAGLVRLVAVVLVPIGVHMFIVLREAYSRNQAAARAAELAEAEASAPADPIVVEVPARVTPEIDPANVENPRAVAYKLLMWVHEQSGNRNQVGPARRQFEAAMAQQNA